MKIIVAGYRDFHDYHFVANKITEIVANYYSVWRGDRIEIVSGGAKGVDKSAKKWASIHGVKFTPFPANWTKYKLAAGPIRNQEMVDYVKHDNSLLIAFLSTSSVGTKDIIERAKKCGVSVEVVAI